MSELATVAALYVDPRGPYPKMAGVECWDEVRDARTYAGPWPVVAHPPCGPWGNLRNHCRFQDKSAGPDAIGKVRLWGGLLEHPARSTLWRHALLPYPGELPDAHGGWSIEVDQVAWGHACQKRTWIYFVGIPMAMLRGQFRFGGVPTHVIACDRRARARSGLLEASAEIRRRTPPAFAVWLVELARSARRP